MQIIYNVIKKTVDYCVDLYHTIGDAIMEANEARAEYFIKNNQEFFKSFTGPKK
jgi:hypothetical protein